MGIGHGIQIPRLQPLDHGPTEYELTIYQRLRNQITKTKNGLKKIALE